MSNQDQHIENKINVPELKIQYNRDNSKSIDRSISSSYDASKFFRSLFNTGELELRESLYVMFLNRANYPIGYYQHSIGGIDSTVADIRIIIGIALKALATGVIIAHNHPSGRVLASQSDIDLTKKLKEASSKFDIQVIDSLIIGKDEYNSLADSGLMGGNSPYPLPEFKPLVIQNDFVEYIRKNLKERNKLTRPQTEKQANRFGIIDRTKIKELTELAIVIEAREIAQSQSSVLEKFNNIKTLYEVQTNLSFRTSMSILLQQYSTPAPIGYLMGLFCGVDDSSKSLFEPSAGNGLLTITANPKQVIVNEIDPVRYENLTKQGYKEVMKIDASIPFQGMCKKFDAVITNPPFGRLDTGRSFDGFQIKKLDHLMALNALETMKDNGKSAIIIGGHTKWDEKKRIQKGALRVFYNYLYKHYHVVDVISISGKHLYSRQGTSFNTTLILINGRKEKPRGVAPIKNQQLANTITDYNELFTRIQQNMKTLKQHKVASKESLRKKALKMKAMLLAQQLGAPYVPASDSCFVLDTHVPDAMEFEMHQAISRIKEDVGGDIDNFVRHRLGYKTKAQLCKALSAEQIDAVGMAIYNIEALNQAVIIGDQTGIGKGRVAASIIRYATQQGITPIFLTEKANLFSDIYRDLSAIGSAQLKPFIVNARGSKTQIKDENGNVIYEALSKPEQDNAFNNRKVPSGHDFVVATYSQFNSAQKKPLKPQFLLEIAKGSIIIMDESHNSSGSSNTGIFMQSVLARTSGAVFLSATFAKRPDNMPIYAMKTAISEANMSKEELVEAISKGGVALQEVLASQLVAEGQMIRRERTYEGIEVNYITLHDKAKEHKAIADNITTIVRDIIAFQANHIDERVDELDSIAVAEGKEVNLREGTAEGGVDNQPYFSKVFNVINQMLFSIKAEAVADKAIARLKQGKKPIIAFASTMGSFIEQMDNSNGLSVGVGDTIKADFSIVLEKGLDGVMRYTETLPNGEKEYKKFDLTELSYEAQEEYERISSNIRKISTGITISPIDVIVQKIEKAGYSVAEVTGRKLKLQLNLKSGMGVIENRKKINTNDAFREFNDNEVDVLLINQSGSTGASAHAIVTDKVSNAEVKQRVMIVLQPELDINTEVQKRGRINRTGQILKPIYDYVNSAIPAEQRLMMMLQKKLKSLDANTSSNQKQSNSILDVPDFLNKYGDKVVAEYLEENTGINDLLGNPLKIGTGSEFKDGGAHKVSGRVAVLSTKMQEDFYKDIKERYDTLVDYLKQSGEYDLEVEQLDLKAKVISSSIIKVGKGGNSSFGEDSVLEKVEANVLRKPFSADEVKNLIYQGLEGQTTEGLREKLTREYETFVSKKLAETFQELESRYMRLKRDVSNEKKIQKLIQAEDPNVAQAIEKRKQELDETYRKRVADEDKSAQNKKSYIRGLFKYFGVGKKLFYPVPSFDGTSQNQLAIFLGFGIDKKKTNPYAPSAIKLKFAIASSQKYIAIPASYIKDINAIKGASIGITDYDIDKNIEQWDEQIKSTTKDRSVRYIVTGNILQAFASFKGKLVSYTTDNNEIKKGILMPEHWSAETETKGKVIVPIAKATKIIKSMSNGSSIFGTSSISFFKLYDNRYRVSVPASRKKGGEIYLNESLLKLVENNVFEKVGSQMTTHVPFENIESFLTILQDSSGVTISVTQNQIDAVGLVVTKTKKRVKIQAPPKEVIPKMNTKVLKLKANALKLKLELLSFA